MLFYKSVEDLKKDELNINKVFTDILNSKKITDISINYKNANRLDIDNTLSIVSGDKVFDVAKVANWTNIIVDWLTYDKDVVAVDIEILINPKE